LLPLCDMPNHRRGSPPLQNLQSEKGPTAVGFRANRRLEQGSEVTVTYNHYHLAGQMLNYGFGEEGAHPVLMSLLWTELESSPQDDPLTPLKSKIFSGNGCESHETEKYVMERGGDVIIEALLPCARVLSLTAALAEPMLDSVTDDSPEAYMAAIVTRLRGPLPREAETDALLTLEAAVQNKIRLDEVWRKDVLPSLTIRAPKETHIGPLISARDLEVQRLRQAAAYIDMLALRLTGSDSGDDDDHLGDL